jgi:hypothetical protein
MFIYYSFFPLTACAGGLCDRMWLHGCHYCKAFDFIKRKCVSGVNVIRK